jgi:hypothetical protein
MDDACVLPRPAMALDPHDAFFVASSGSNFLQRPQKQGHESASSAKWI